jgi:hypothetical protein
MEKSETIDNGLIPPFNRCMLGNLSVEQFILQSTLKPSNEDINWLKEHRQDKADVTNPQKLHIFDIPLVVHCGSIELAREFADKFRKYDLSNCPKIQVSYR